VVKAGCILPGYGNGPDMGEWLHGENGGGVGARNPPGWAETLALLLVLAGMLRLPIGAIAGRVS
jgi:hypothetical protein